LRGGAPNARRDRADGLIKLGDSDSLVSTKLRPPCLRTNLVARPRLTEKLEREPERRLTLISAPAGFGKTALLGEWLGGCAGGESSVAWISLDEGDNDPARFLSYLVAALRSIEEEIGEGVLSSLRAPGYSQAEALTGAFLNELADFPGELAIILDDYHLIDSHHVHGIVSFMLDRLPSNVHLVIASRIDPPMPFARLRARGQIAEINAADLSFAQEEAAAFLKDTMGLDLSAEDVAALEERTEGWIAGLQLAALSMRDRKDVPGFVRAFSGSHRDVLDFLSEEVLERQSERIRSFLLETSILERLTGELCDAVTDRDDGLEMLETLERENLFIVALDDERRWYRYHHLFADFLHGRMKHERPERVKELHLRAASWYERNGWASEAVEHALAAGEVEWAAPLIEHNAQALFQRGEGATVDQWLTALPAELVRSRPRLSLARAVWVLIGGRVDEVEPLLTDAERALATVDQPHELSVDEAARGLANVPGTVAMLRAELARQRGDVEHTIQFAQRARAYADENDRHLCFFVSWNLAVAKQMQGRLGEAEDALAELAADPYVTGQHCYFAVRAYYTLGQVQRAQGRLNAALRTCRQGLELAAEAARPVLSAAGVAHVGVAEVLHERNELDAALDHVTRGVALCRQLAYAQWLVTGLTALARIRQARGDQAGALEAIGEAERLVPNQESLVDIIFPVAVQRARLLLAQGKVDDPARWSAERGLGVEDEPSYLRESEHLVLARVLLAQDKPDQALRLLKRLREEAQAAGGSGSEIEILTLQALALREKGEKEQAVSTLTQALALAEPEGYVRTFVDEGPQMVALLSEVLEAQQRGRLHPLVSAHYLRKLLAALERDASDAAPPGADLLEPLSDRELEVLALVDAGRTNQEIAEELFVAKSTVKTHIKNIYGKLDVRNRTQALVRARELGLL
jgi:LuxR family transcriptional regulator, maltose regulon positive regulatory protein